MLTENISFDASCVSIDQSHQCQPQRNDETNSLTMKKWRWSGKAKPIIAKPKAKTSYLIDVVGDSRLWCNVPTHLWLFISKNTYRLSKKRKHRCDIKTWNGNIMHMVKNQLWHVRTKQSRQKVNKDDCTYIKEQRSINRLPCVNVNQVYLVVQLGLGWNSSKNM